MWDGSKWWALAAWCHHHNARVLLQKSLIFVGLLCKRVLSIRDPIDWYCFSMESGVFPRGNQTRNSAATGGSCTTLQMLFISRLDMSNRGKVIEKPRVAAESRVRFPRMKSPDFIIIAMFLQTTQLRVWDCSTARVDNSTTNPLCISCGILLSSPSVVLGRQSCRSGSPGLYVVLPRWLTVILPETPNHFVGYPGYPLLLG